MFFDDESLKLITVETSRYSKTGKPAMDNIIRKEDYRKLVAKNAIMRQILSYNHLIIACVYSRKKIAPRFCHYTIPFYDYTPLRNFYRKLTIGSSGIYFCSKTNYRV